MKKFLSVCLSMFMMASLFTGCGDTGSGKNQGAGNGEKVKIGVVQYMDHPSLDTIRDSFKAQMISLGYSEDAMEFQSAGGDGVTQSAIVQSFSGDQKDVVVAIATPTAQAAANISNQIPVVFSAVSDPVGAGLVESLEAPGGNITGTSDEIQVELILELALKINPDLKKLGFIYNTGEANSMTNLAKAKAFCESHSIELIETAVTNTNEVQAAAQILCTKVEAVFAPNDNTVASAMAALANTAIQAKVPVYCGADSMVNDGGFATVGINYEDLGKETANMVDQVLKGKKAGEIPVKVFNSDLATIINEETANALGISDYEQYME